MKKVSNKLIKGERGQALPIVLVLLILGGLVIAPLLSFIGAGIIAGDVHEEKAKELYAADAGVEDALWKVKNEDPADDWGWAYDIWDNDYYTQSHAYTISTVNGEDVDVVIQPIWILEGMGDECLGTNPPPGQTPHQELMVVGDYIGLQDGNGLYQISLTYEGGGNKHVWKIGVWLPAGWEYVAGTSNLGFDPDPFDRRGGTAYVWDFGTTPGLMFSDLPPTGEDEKTITFQFTPSTIPPGAFCWIRMHPSDIALSWDADVKIFKVTSTAGNTTVEAYTPTNEFREMSAAVEGDYLAIGNSLMARSSSSIKYRDILLPDSTATAGSIPPDAEVSGAYLYWSGWYEGENQTGVPTADGDYDGTWNTSPCWDDVDETTPNDADYMIGTTNPGGYKLFSFSPFSIPTGAYISDLTVYVRARDDGSSGTNNIRPSIRVNDTRYNTVFAGNNPWSNFRTYSYSYTTNPDTGLAWVAEDLNGTGPNPLQQFGVYSSDLNPDVRVSMVYARVNYVVADTTCTFSIDGTQVYFDGGGNPQQGATELTADTAQVIDNTSYGNPHGYSYACKKDVTDLIRAFAEDDDGIPGDDGDESNDYYHPGNAAYTVGGVDATWDASDEWAYAGWSLVIIYTSTTTEGHQLYLFDTFSYCDHNTNLDFDYDGQPGGTISGFLVPEPVPGETDAAKMTAFVGEGDIWYTGDYLKFNDTKLWDGITCTGNSQSSPNNVWNGESIGMSAEGVDVDTFYVSWASGLLTPGDSSAQVDIYTDIDIWNLVYIILSFRSQTTTGGTMIYIIQ